MRCEEMEIMIPPYFRCPISLDLIEDPVTLWTGQTYDRSCIEKWLAAGNSTCPVTMQKLHDSSMVPNHTLRHLIHEWLQSNEDYFVPDFSDKQILVDRVKHIIESDAFAFDSKMRALEEAHSLSQELPLENSCLIKLNFFQTLIDKVFGIEVESLHSRENSMLIERALSSALNLMPFSEIACLNILKQDCKHAVFLSLLEKGSVFVKKALCLVVEAVSLESQTRQLCEKLGRSARVIRAIVRIIEQREDEKVADSGIRALSGLSSIGSNLETIARQGAVEVLVACLSDMEKERRAAAMAAIERLVAERSARGAVLSHTSGVGAVVKMVFRVSEHEGSESALNSLLILCLDCEIAREKAIGEGVLTQLLLLLQSQSSGRVKSKGRLLLKMLRSK